MCLVAWAWRPHSEQPLWVAGNRDESWQRPTEPLSHWRLPDGTRVLGGRDGLAAGAWLAFGSGGRLAMLTNVRTDGPQRAAPRSRGGLVVSWLAARGRQRSWQDWLREHPCHAYGGCNLVLADLPRGVWQWLTNVDPRQHEGLPAGLENLDGWWAAPVPPGVHVLSNAALDTPWPKAKALREALQQAIAKPTAPTAVEGALLAALQTHVPGHEGDPASLEASPWVSWPQRRYGTRSSLIARAEGDGRLHVAEWTYRPELGVDGTDCAEVRRSSMAWWGMPTSS